MLLLGLLFCVVAAGCFVVCMSCVVDVVIYRVGIRYVICGVVVASVCCFSGGVVGVIVVVAVVVVGVVVVVSGVADGYVVGVGVLGCRGCWLR